MPEAPNTIWVKVDHDGVLWGPARYATSLGCANPVEYARVTPSVRLARWQDGHPDRIVRRMERWRGRGGQVVRVDVELIDEHHKRHEQSAPTRDEALSGALDKAEAATPEGGETDAA